MKHANLIFAGVIWLLGTVAVMAQPAVEKILPLDAQIAKDGRSITLSWFDATPPRVGSVTVKRRLYGQIGGATWQTLATGLGPVMRYTDDTIRPSVAYEYQVLRTARDIVDVGYWLAGTEVPAQSRHGNAYVIVDETVVGAITPRLERFERDLIGDGWTVQRHTAPRGDARKPAENLENALVLKDWLRTRYSEDPFGQHVVFLVGHVPVVKSGKAAPDGHGGRPHPTDLFYADMDGRWSALRSGELLDSRVPGDFIEMQVGRIDFEPVSAADQETEIRLLRAYFDKNHHWRMGYVRGVDGAYGKTEHLAVEIASLRNIVGPANITTGGHHDVGEERPWLWGVDFGALDGSRYANDFNNKAVFTLNFGSHKQMITNRFNGMTALLAQRWYPLTVGWGARPAWWLHHMALGGSIGDVHMRTVNNGRAAEPYRESMDYYPTGRYLMRNSIWINLLGDPTLRAFPLAPPSRATTQPVAEGLKLSWEASPDSDTLGYHVFRAPAEQTAFKRLTGPDPVTATEFIDTGPVEGARYMICAYGLKEVYAGSFFTYSQGVFTQNKPHAETGTDPPGEMRTPVSQSLRLPDVFNDPTNGKIHAIIQEPAVGTITQDGMGWVYTPPAGYEGQVNLHFSVSGNWQTTHERLQLSIRD